MKYSEMKNRFETLMEVSELTLPRKVSVAIARNISNFRKELEIYNEQDADIAKRYVAKDKDGKPVLDGNMYTFASEVDRENFIRERNELNSAEVDVDIIKFNSSDLDGCYDSDRYEIMIPAQESSIEWMIDYDA